MMLDVNSLKFFSDERTQITKLPTAVTLFDNSVTDIQISLCADFLKTYLLIVYDHDHSWHVVAYDIFGIYFRTIIWGLD